MKIITYSTLNDVDKDTAKILATLTFPEGRMSETLSYYFRGKKKVLSKTAVFLAYEKKELIGWATFDGNFDTFVRKDHRGQGVGTKLLIAGQQFIKKNPGFSEFAPRAMYGDEAGKRLYAKTKGWKISFEP